MPLAKLFVCISVSSRHHARLPRAPWHSAAQRPRGASRGQWPPYVYRARQRAGTAFFAVVFSHTYLSLTKLLFACRPLLRVCKRAAGAHAARAHAARGRGHHRAAQGRRNVQIRFPRPTALPPLLALRRRRAPLLVLWCPKAGEVRSASAALRRAAQSHTAP